MMFILGQSDYRTPQDSGGEQLFRALKFLKRPTAMVVFPRETHELSRSGEPWHRIERLQSIVGWFDMWLMACRIRSSKYDRRRRPLSLRRINSQFSGTCARVMTGLCPVTEVLFTIADHRIGQGVVEGAKPWLVVLPLQRTFAKNSLADLF